MNADLGEFGGDAAAPMAPQPEPSGMGAGRERDEARGDGEFARPEGDSPGEMRPCVGGERPQAICARMWTAPMLARPGGWRGSRHESRCVRDGCDAERSG